MKFEKSKLKNKKYSVITPKGKKINFVATVNPCTLTQLNGSITNLANNTAFENINGSSSFTATTSKIHINDHDMGIQNL